MDETHPSVAAVKASSPIAKFWPRIFAFFIDLMILGVVGGALGFVFWGALVHLHNWARLIGFTIALAYFGILESRIGGGRTIGMRLIGNMAVIDRNGKAVSFPRSALRFLVLALPWFTNGLLFREGPSQLVTAVLMMTVFGLGFAIIYLYIANRRTRQSLHDVVAGTYVVKPAEISGLDFGVTSSIHFKVIGAVWVLLLLSQLIDLRSLMGTQLASKAESMNAIRQAAIDVPDVWTATVMDTTTTLHIMTGPNPTTTVKTALTVNVYVDSTSVVDSQFAARVAARILAAAPDMPGNANLAVRVIRAFDIGIASFSNTTLVTKTADDWRNTAGA